MECRDRWDLEEAIAYGLAAGFGLMSVIMVLFLLHRSGKLTGRVRSEVQDARMEIRRVRDIVDIVEIRTAALGRVLDRLERVLESKENRRGGHRVVHGPQDVVVEINDAGDVARKSEEFVESGEENDCYINMAAWRTGARPKVKGTGRGRRQGKRGQRVMTVLPKVTEEGNDNESGEGEVSAAVNI